MRFFWNESTKQLAGVVHWDNNAEGPPSQKTNTMSHANAADSRVLPETTGCNSVRRAHCALLLFLVCAHSQRALMELALPWCLMRSWRTLVSSARVSGGGDAMERTQ